MPKLQELLIRDNDDLEIINLDLKKLTKLTVINNDKLRKINLLHKSPITDTATFPAPSNSLSRASSWGAHQPTTFPRPSLSQRPMTTEQRQPESPQDGDNSQKDSPRSKSGHLSWVAGLFLSKKTKERIKEDIEKQMKQKVEEIFSSDEIRKIQKNSKQKNPKK